MALAGHNKRPGVTATAQFEAFPLAECHLLLVPGISSNGKGVPNPRRGRRYAGKPESSNNLVPLVVGDPAVM